MTKNSINSNSKLKSKPKPNSETQNSDDLIDPEKVLNFGYWLYLLIITLIFIIFAGFNSSKNQKMLQFTNKLEIKTDKNSKPDQKNQLPSIIFFKTHKTGSSAIQNILFRLAFDRGLTIGWPANSTTESTSLRYPYKFEPKYILNPIYRLRFCRFLLFDFLPAPKFTAVNSTFFAESSEVYIPKFAQTKSGDPEK